MPAIAGNISTTAVLSPREIESHIIASRGDYDWFSVSLSAGMSYSFTVSSFGGPGIGLTGPDLYLYDGFGAPIGSSVQFSASTGTITYTAVSTGTFFVGVGDTGNQSGQYALSWAAGDTIRANVGTSRTLIANGPVTSALDASHDADWFKMAMTAGLTYGYELKSSGANGLADPDLQLRDAGGNIIATTTLFSISINLIPFHATVTGDYFATAWDSNGDTGGHVLRWIATDSIQNNLSTAMTLNRNSSALSRLDVAGDADWFRVTLIAGETYGFQLKSQGVGGLFAGDLRLLDADGNVVSSFTAFSAAPDTLAHTAITSGTYFVAVLDSNGGAGGYSLVNLGQDLVRANASTTRVLTEGGRVAGTIDMTTDSDWYRIEAHQVQAYVFTLSGNGSVNELEQVRLILRDEAGNVLLEDYGATSLISYVAAASGPLFLDVRGQFADDTGAYLLSVVPDAPTIEGTTAADRLQGGAGNTVMNGLAGNDWIDGGVGNDLLEGQLGSDQLHWGATPTPSCSVQLQGPIPFWTFRMASTGSA